MQQATLDYEDDGFQIKVNITKTEVKGGTNKFVVYTISGEDKNGVFEVIRRYSEFDSVRSVLLNRWPGCYVASLPEKKMVGNMDALFIQNRRLGLQEFLINISKIKHLWYSEEFQILVRALTADVEKAIAPFTKPNPSQIIQRYQSCFKNLNNKEINPEVVGKINSFMNYLKKTLPILEYYKESSRVNNQTRRRYNQQTYTLLQFMLPQYQKHCMKQYLPPDSQDSLVFLNNKDSTFTQSKEKVKQLNAAKQLDLLHLTFQTQQRQVESFLEVLKVKQNYENLKQKARQKLKDIESDKQKALAGKSSISAMLKSKSKQQNLKILESEYEKAQKQQAQYVLICDISTVLLSYIEINKFKKLREKNYYELLKKVIKFEFELSKAHNELWNCIVESESIQKTNEQ